MHKSKVLEEGSSLLVPIGLIDRRIYLIRGQKVMVDSDLAELYQVRTGNLNLAVRRNLKRFPLDFMFQLTKQEAESLLLQTAIAKVGRGGRQMPPHVFTEHGVSMLSSVLRGDRAVQMNILIIRAFIRMRELLATHKELAGKIERIELKQKQRSSVIGILADEIERLKRSPPVPPKSKIGFVAETGSF